jgi:hypothetical protein
MDISPADIRFFELATQRGKALLQAAEQLPIDDDAPSSVKRLREYPLAGYWTAFVAAASELGEVLRLPVIGMTAQHGLNRHAVGSQRLNLAFPLLIHDVAREHAIAIKTHTMSLLESASLRIQYEFENRRLNDQGPYVLPLHTEGPQAALPRFLKLQRTQLELLRSAIRATEGFLEGFAAVHPVEAKSRNAASNTPKKGDAPKSKLPRKSRAANDLTLLRCALETFHRWGQPGERPEAPTMAELHKLLKQLKWTDCKLSRVFSKLIPGGCGRTSVRPEWK